MWTVKLRHKDKSAQCGFFVAPVDGQALLGMSDIELLNILRITCEVISESHESRKLDSQTIEASTSPSCRTTRAPWNETDKVHTHDNNTNRPDYFRPNTNKTLDKRASQVLTNKIQEEFSDIFSHRLF